MEDDLDKLKSRFADNAHLLAPPAPEKEDQILSPEEVKFVTKVFGPETVANVAKYHEKIKHFNRFSFNPLNVAMARKIWKSPDNKQYLTETPTMDQIEHAVTKEIKRNKMEDDFKEFELEHPEKNKSGRKYHTIVPTFLNVGPLSFFKLVTHTISSRKPREEKGQWKSPSFSRMDLILERLRRCNFWERLSFLMESRKLSFY
jgi:hypothetical protein